MQAQVDAGTCVGPTSDELEEIRKLKRENCDLEEVKEIPKAASPMILMA